MKENGETKENKSGMTNGAKQSTTSPDPEIYWSQLKKLQLHRAKKWFECDHLIVATILQRNRLLVVENNGTITVGLLFFIFIYLQLCECAVRNGW